MTAKNISVYIQGFLQDYLSIQKGYSRNTVLSYRDSIKLFLQHCAKLKKLNVTQLALSDLTADIVTDFLDNIEKIRGNTRQTRNVRLSCLHSLFRHLATQDPFYMDQCQQILSIPYKRTQTTVVEYLEREEIHALLSVIDSTTTDGLRDYALFSFMHNTGTRAQETLNLTASSFQLQRPYQVRILGKGAKERLCPLWPVTVKTIQSLFEIRGLTSTDDTPVFVNHNGQPLTRHVIRYLLNKYINLASVDCPSLKNKRIHPHSIRHGTAMGLLQAGVDINTIRAWLGHTNIVTTNKYAEINIEMKRKVLEKYLPTHKTKKTWKRNPDLLQWLESL